MRLFNIAFAILTISAHAQAAEETLFMPPELVGAWGNEITCIAYHRGALHYLIQEDGSIVFKNGNEDEKWCQITEKSVNSLNYKAKCFKSSVSDNSIQIRINNDDAVYEMIWNNPSSTSAIFLHKCDDTDKIRGIGKDIIEITGDLGTAHHAGFVIGYGTSSAEHCGYKDLNEDIAQLVLIEGASAGERYGHQIKALPAVKYGQELVLKSSEEGIYASMIDRNEIPDFCMWFYKAYVPSGWAIKGLINSSAH